jgi:hypothetical protein
VHYKRSRIQEINLHISGLLLAGVSDWADGFIARRFDGQQASSGACRIFRRIFQFDVRFLVCPWIDFGPTCG